ncbi:MAG: tetratricopeptide repeat protein, partial [Bacteroidales bacterium]|nr:tetratricopeptide repeat protein [Bacteroidales bacterium]
MRRILSISLFLLLTLILAGCTHELEDKMGAYLDQVEEGLADFNTHDVKDMEKTASWFERHGDTGQQARALYCLGRTQFNAGSYSAAIVSYTRALEL